jgi:ribosomal protein S15P/S13E|tara:strand:- start:1094 stop:1462 length:369 start_codon:yes stop_codon:yes gene_type:complete
MLKKTEDKKPEKEVKPSKKLSQVDYEKKILELSKKGLTSEKIGEQLRQQGIHTKENSKKVSKVLKENGDYVIPDLKNIEEKLEKIKKHYEENKQDKRAMRERDRTAAKLRKLKKYLKISLKR